MLLLTESVFVSLLAGAVGLFIAEIGLNFIRAQRSGDLPRFSEISLDWHVFAFAFGVSIFSGVFFVLAPALAGANLDLNAPLKESNWKSPGGRHRISSGTLTVMPFGLATILIFCSGLLRSSLLRVLRVVRIQSRPPSDFAIFLSPSGTGRIPKGSAAVRTKCWNASARCQRRWRNCELLPITVAQ
jgi:hypothetical protein